RRNRNGQPQAAVDQHCERADDRSTSLTSHPGGNERRRHPPGPPKSIRNMGFLWLLPLLPVLLLAFVGLRYLVRGTPVTRVRGGRRPYAASELSAERFVQSLELH